eukprot:scaffold2975_cov135-Skeletonema_menzelii.AAC.6
MEAGGREAKGEQVSGIRRKCRRSPPKIDRFLFSPATTCDMSDVVRSISMDMEISTATTRPRQEEVAG